MTPSRPSFPLDWRSRRPLGVDQLRLAISTLAIAILLFAATVWLIVSYL